MKQKYGFVYIWRDRKRKRYYIGCHWGTENDRYICSSNWMRDAYRKRPSDFKRRILSRIYTNKKDMFDKEYEWLKLIKDNELSIRYYNLHNNCKNHWSGSDNCKNICKKLSLSYSREGYHHSIETRLKIGKGNKNKKLSEETKQKMRTPKSEEHKQKLKGRKFSEEHKQKLKLPKSEEHKRKMSESAKIRWKKIKIIGVDNE